MQITYSLSDFVRNGTNLPQLMNTHPLLLKLGRMSSPILRRSRYDQVATLDFDDSYLTAAREAGSNFVQAGDWRCASGYYSNWLQSFMR